METIQANQPTTTRFSDTSSFTVLQTEAALCAWEWMCEERDSARLRPYFEGFGSSAMRHCSMQAGDIALRVHDHMQAQGYEFADAYDWEFVPSVLTRLDWTALIEDNQFNKGIYAPDVHSIFCSMVAAEKARCANPEHRAFQLTREASYAAKCRAEAERQWGYGDLVTDHPERVTNAMEAGEDPATFILWLGEKYDLTPVTSMQVAS